MTSITEWQYLKSHEDVAELEAKPQPLDSVDTRLLANLESQIAEYEAELGKNGAPLPHPED